MTGSGGWPMTVFLDPDGPAVLRRHVLPAGGPPGHARLRAPHGRGRRRVAQPARRARRAGRAAAPGHRGEHRRSAAAVAGCAVVRRDPRPGGRRASRGQFDARFGGFGRAPKFPQAMTLTFLLDLAALATRGPRSLEMVTVLARRDGRGRHLRPGRRRLPPLLGRRALARAPLREDAVRPGAARARVPARHGWSPAPTATAGSSRRRSPTCCATCATPTAASSPPRTPTPRASKGKFYVWSLEELEAAQRRRRCPSVVRHFGVTARGNFEDPHTGFRGNILHAVGPTETSPDAVAAGPARRCSPRASSGCVPGSTTRCCSGGTRCSCAR